MAEEVMDFKEIAKKLWLEFGCEVGGMDYSIREKTFTDPIIKYLQEAYQQGREEQRKRDIQIVENVIERVCGDKNSVVTRKIKEEILFARGES